jgi:hypothetical protein
MKKSIATVVGMGLLGAGMFASNASAVMSCSKVSSGWNAAQELNCRFDGQGWESAFAQTQSGVSNGTKGMIANLVSTFNIQPGYVAAAAAVGLDGSGQVIPDCFTGFDFSTEQGASVTDSTGCQNGQTHLIWIQKGLE